MKTITKISLGLIILASAIICGCSHQSGQNLETIKVFRKNLDKASHCIVTSRETVKVACKHKRIANALNLSLQHFESAIASLRMSTQLNDESKKEKLIESARNSINAGEDIIRKVQIKGDNDEKMLALLIKMISDELNTSTALAEIL
jgi:hypothetical protein